jgi:hypothetical protein
MTGLYKLNDLATKLHIHYRTANKLLKDLQISFPNKDKYPFLHRYVGKRIRFTEDDLDKIVEILPKK